VVRWRHLPEHIHSVRTVSANVAPEAGETWPRLAELNVRLACGFTLGAGGRVDCEVAYERDTALITQRSPSDQGRLSGSIDARLRGFISARCALTLRSSYVRCLSGLREHQRCRVR
jgi:hypothetical protein